MPKLTGGITNGNGEAKEPKKTRAEARNPVKSLRKLYDQSTTNPPLNASGSSKKGGLGSSKTKLVTSGEKRRSMSPEDPADRHLSAVKTPLQIPHLPVFHGSSDDSHPADRSRGSPETSSSPLARANDKSHESNDSKPRPEREGWNFFHNTKLTLSDKDCPAKAQRSRSYEDQDGEDFEHGSGRKRARVVDRQEDFDRVSDGHHDLQQLGGAQGAAPSATSHASPVGENRGKHSQSDLVLVQGNLTNAHADSHDDWSLISCESCDVTAFGLSGLTAEQLAVVGETEEGLLRRYRTFTAEDFIQYRKTLWSLYEANRPQETSYHHSSADETQLTVLRAELAATKEKLERAQAIATAPTSQNLAGWTVQEPIKPLTKPSFQAARDFCDQLKRFEDNGGKLDRLRLVNETVAAHMEAGFMARSWLTQETRKDWVQWPLKLLWERLRQIWPNSGQKTSANTPLSVLFTNVRLSSYDVLNQEGFNNYAIRVLSIRHDAVNHDGDEKAAVDVLIKNIDAVHNDGGRTVQPTLGAVSMARRVKLDPRPINVDQIHRKICAINEEARDRVSRASEWLSIGNSAQGRVDDKKADNGGRGKASQGASSNATRSEPRTDSKKGDSKIICSGCGHMGALRKDCSKCPGHPDRNNDKVKFSDSKAAEQLRKRGITMTRLDLNARADGTPLTEAQKKAMQIARDNKSKTGESVVAAMSRAVQHRGYCLTRCGNLETKTVCCSAARLEAKRNPLFYL
jgi:hypothetical protein